MVERLFKIRYETYCVCSNPLPIVGLCHYVTPVTTCAINADSWPTTGTLTWICALLGGLDARLESCRLQWCCFLQNLQMAFEPQSLRWCFELWQLKHKRFCCTILLLSSSVVGRSDITLSRGMVFLTIHTRILRWRFCTLYLVEHGRWLTWIKLLTWPHTHRRRRDFACFYYSNFSIKSGSQLIQRELVLIMLPSNTFLHVTWKFG